jgi:hypothetical protein
LIFTLVGYFLYKSGKKEGFEKITALQNGIAAEGEISEISYDTSETMMESIRIWLNICSLQQAVNHKQTV